MLDPQGELTDFLVTPALGGRSRTAAAAAARASELLALQRFMEEHSPHLVFVGASSLACRELKERIYEVIKKIMEETPTAIPHETQVIDVLLVDEAVARVAETSRAAEELLQGRPPAVKRAVALGRGVLDPLALLASLCGAGREVLSLALHPLLPWVLDMSQPPEPAMQVGPRP